jgi:hypothetical protein
MSVHDDKPVRYMEELIRPKFIGGEFHTNELFEQCPAIVLAEAVIAGGNIAFDMHHTAEYTPHGQAVENFWVPTNFRVVKPR